MANLEDDKYLLSIELFFETGLEYMSQPDYTLDQRENMARIKRHIIEEKFDMPINLTVADGAVNDMLEFPYTDDVMMDLSPQYEAGARREILVMEINPITGRYPFRDDDILFIHHKFDTKNRSMIDVQFSFYNLTKKIFLFQRFIWLSPRNFQSYWFTMDKALTKFNNDDQLCVIAKYVEEVFRENHKRTEYIRSRPALAEQHKIYDLGTPAEFALKLARQYSLFK